MVFKDHGGLVMLPIYNNSCRLFVAHHFNYFDAFLTFWISDAKLILHREPHAAHFDLQWAGPAKFLFLSVWRNLAAQQTAADAPALNDVL